MIPRRRVLVAPLALVGAASQAQPRRAFADPMRLGADPALIDSGLAPALQKAFARETGLPLRLVRSPALPLLDALERGEIDAALANAPEAESRLAQQGLAHDRHAVADGDFVLVGPAPRGAAKDPALVAGSAGTDEALQKLFAAALALPGTVTFLSAGDGSGTHVLEQSLWRHARIAPAAPWHVVASPASSLLAQARARGAYALVERGAWLADGGAPLAVLVQDDPLLREQVHVMRSFRVSHPTGRIFMAWIGGPKGARVAAAQRGYRRPA